MKKTWQIYNEKTGESENIKLYFVCKNGQTIVYFLPSELFYEKLQKERSDLTIRCKNRAGGITLEGMVYKEDLDASYATNLRVYLDTPLSIQSEEDIEDECAKIGLSYKEKEYVSEDFFVRKESDDYRWKTEQLGQENISNWENDLDTINVPDWEKDQNTKNDQKRENDRIIKKNENQTKIVESIQESEENEPVTEGKKSVDDEEHAVKKKESFCYDERERENEKSIRKITNLSELGEDMSFRTYQSNSFLLHGYYNYGHVIIEKNEDKERLGVPGNYHKRELYMAKMFGFSTFEPKNQNIEVKNGTYGYYFT